MKKLLLLILMILPLIGISQDANDPSTYSDCNSFTDTINICRNSLVDFEEFSYSNNLKSYEWHWWFQGANPDTSTKQNPDNIRYNNPGLFYVKCSTMYYNTVFLNFRTSSVKCMMVRVLENNTFGNIPINDTSICEGDEIVLDATYNQFNDNDTIEPLKINYLWTSATSSIDEIFVTTPTLNINKPGKYKVRVFTNCSSNEKEIEVDYRNCGYNIPNAFTPNGDGLNDIYKINVDEYKSFKLLIYNRWGELIFTSNDPLIGWDGSYKNKQPLSGVYMAIISIDNKKFNKSIHLIN